MNTNPENGYKNDSEPKQTWVRYLLALARVIVYTRYSLLAGLLLLTLGIVLPLLALLPISAVQAVYSMPDDSWRMFSTSIMSMVTAAFVITTFRVTLCNAAARFDDPEVDRFWQEPSKRVHFLRGISIWIFGLPLPVACYLHTLHETQQQGTQLAQLILGIAFAWAALCLTYHIILWLVTPDLFDARILPLNFNWIGKLLRKNSPTNSGSGTNSKPVKLPLMVVEPIARFCKRLGLTQGYIEERPVSTGAGTNGDETPPTKLVLAPGHFSLLLMTNILLGIYIYEFFRARSTADYPEDGANFGTLIFALGLLMILTGTLPAISFFFDRLRIPTLLVLGLAGFAVSFLAPHHEFEVAPSLPKDHSKSDSIGFLAAPLNLMEVIEGWKLRQDAIATENSPANRTFVIVTAAGGGIQASGWTTEVLRGLEDSTDGKFSRSIGIISSVSGGSVGSLFYLAQYPELVEILDSETDNSGSADGSPTIDATTLLTHAHDQSTKSSLECVGWGLMFPDSIRVTGFMQDSLFDRAAIQERVWQKRMVPFKEFTDRGSSNFNFSLEDLGHGRPDWRLGHLASAVKSGKLPAVVFNTFLVDTGQRVWMAPFVLRDKEIATVTSQAKRQAAKASDASSYATSRVRKSYDFLEYAQADDSMQTRLSSAARLSATFPYVAPTVRPQKKYTPTSATGKLIENRHFGDGGYTDNESLQTALFLAKEVAECASKMKENPIDRILLVRIAPFPVG
ncbi:MAG: hypothetical protein AAF483_04265, partial [Planctomycetota bacterium]